MTPQPTHETSKMEDAARIGTGRVKMAWFEHGTSRIYYEEQGTGDPVLVLPGFAGSIEEFAALREALVTAGYRVIAADLPGSGRSEPQPRAYTATYYEDDARSFAALLQHLATGPAHLIGFSDGGDDLLAHGSSDARRRTLCGDLGRGGRDQRSRRTSAGGDVQHG